MAGGRGLFYRRRDARSIVMPPTVGLHHVALAPWSSRPPWPPFGVHETVPLGPGGAVGCTLQEVGRVALTTGWRSMNDAVKMDEIVPKQAASAGTYG